MAESFQKARAAESFQNARASESFQNTRAADLASHLVYHFLNLTDQDHRADGHTLVPFQPDS